MDAGVIVGERFEVQCKKAAGGMGEVYLARDLTTSRYVALKILRFHSRDMDARFAREASVLRELSHPRIVRYVAHGALPDGHGYLAMEWLEGELLSDKLRAGPLSIDDSLAVATCVCEALAPAHARHIVHRDLKPGNLLCVGGELERITLLDFGLARTEATLLITHTGELAGTPGYMSPEQVRGLHEVDARADVYSLGCILFECLTGRPAFAGDHVFAVLAKILVEDEPRVSEIRRDVPPAVDELVARMLSKDPARRPAGAGELLVELDRARLASASHALPDPRADALGLDERRVLCVILAASDAELARGPDGPTLVSGAVSLATLEKLVHGFGAELLPFTPRADAVITLWSSGLATDLAVRAARLALEVAQCLPDKQVALTCERAEPQKRVAVGAAIDQAATLIAQAARERDEPSTVQRGVPREPHRHAPSPWLPVRIDDTTGGLLDSRFELGAASDGGLLLLAFSEHAGPERTLLGKPTPFLGRQRELANLLGAFASCEAEARAQPLLVTGPAGAGKSRLCAEFVRALMAQHADRKVQVWVSRGDPTAAGESLSLLSRMVRREAGIRRGESLHKSRRKLSARVALSVRERREHVAAFLGEMCGIPFDDRAQPALRAARRDTESMGDQMRSAFEEWVDAECQDAPLVLVLEDLHWGDLPSVRFLDAVLRRLCARPLMLVATARPEVHDAFPRLWATRGLEVVELKPLSERASLTLVQQTLGPQAAELHGARIVQQAQGNAFFLEELIRAAAHGQERPGTVLTMISARLERLKAEQRRLLRAASIFGSTFSAPALSALVAGDVRAIASELDALCADEWVVPQLGPDGAREFSFRHSLVRESAYEMLTPEDRQLGHRLAGEFLVTQPGEGDAATIAEHFERGHAPAQALVWHARAAKRSLDGTDLRAAIARARRGLSCADALPAGEAATERGALRAILAEAYNWSAENQEAEADGKAALGLLTPGEGPWFAAVSQLALAAGRLGHTERVVSLAEQLLDLTITPDTAAAWVSAAAPTAERLAFAAARRDLIARLLAGIEQWAEQASVSDPTASARALVARGLCDGVAGDPGSWLSHLTRAADAFTRYGCHRRAAVQRHDIGFACLRLGAYERAEAELRLSLTLAQELGVARLSSVTRHSLGMAVAALGRAGEAAELHAQAIAEFAEQHDLPKLIAAHQSQCIMALHAGDTQAAERAAKQALALDQPEHLSYGLSQSLLARVHLAQSKPGAALPLAGAAMDALCRASGVFEGEAHVYLALAEALHATGDLRAACDTIERAADRLEKRAARVTDPALRASFLGRIPEHARTRELAAAWRMNHTPP